jgi:hypothetical protein
VFIVYDVADPEDPEGDTPLGDDDGCGYIPYPLEEEVLPVLRERVKALFVKP